MEANRKEVGIYFMGLDRSQWVKRSEVIYTLNQERYSTRKVKAYYVQTPQDQASVIAQQTQWGNGGGNWVVIWGERESVRGTGRRRRVANKEQGGGLEPRSVQRRTKETLQKHNKRPGIIVTLVKEKPNRMLWDTGESVEKGARGFSL